jgi:hypothetical protein
MRWDRDVAADGGCVHGVLAAAGAAGAADLETVRKRPIQ